MVNFIKQEALPLSTVRLSSQFLSQTIATPLQSVVPDSQVAEVTSDAASQTQKGVYKMNDITMKEWGYDPVEFAEECAAMTAYEEECEATHQERLALYSLVNALANVAANTGDSSPVVNKEEEKEMLKRIDVSVGVEIVEVMEFGREGGFKVLMTLPSNIVREVDCNDSDFVISVNYGYFIVSKSSGEIHFSPEPFSLYEEEGAEGMIDPRSQYSPSELLEMEFIDTLKGGEEMKGRLDHYNYNNGEETFFVVAELTAPVAKDLFEIAMADVISYQVSNGFVTVVTLDTIYNVSKSGEIHTSSC